MKGCPCGYDGCFYLAGMRSAGWSGSTDGGCCNQYISVGSYPSGTSPYGAVDMAGNVEEWVADWYDEKYYATSLERNPVGPTASDWGHSVRGGSWWHDSLFDVQTAARAPGMSSFSGDYQNFRGFRCSWSP